MNSNSFKTNHNIETYNSVAGKNMRKVFQSIQNKLEN